MVTISTFGNVEIYDIIYFNNRDVSKKITYSINNKNAVGNTQFGD